MESLLRICNIFTTAGECIDHWETVKESLLYKQHSDGDDDTVATEASDTSISDKHVAAALVQARTRGMLVRNKRLEEARLVKRARIEKNLESVQEMLRSNREVWCRCKQHIRGGGGLPHTVFTRAGYFSVLATTKNNTIKFATRAERSYKAFDTKPLTKLHPKLDGVFEVEYGEYDFVNYSAFLEKTLLFHEDILEPFLEIFKSHLETVQECLDDIDDWIQAPQFNRQFLEKTFDLDSPLEFPDESGLHSATKSSARVAKSLREYELHTDVHITAAFDIGRERHQRNLNRLVEFIKTDQTR